MDLLPLEMLVSILQWLPHHLRWRYTVVSSTWHKAIHLTSLSEEERNFYRRVIAKKSRIVVGLNRSIRMWQNYATIRQGLDYEGLSWRKYEHDLRMHQKYLLACEKDPTFIEKLEENARALHAQIATLNDLCSP